jgi:hypothetical protein
MALERLSISIVANTIGELVSAERDGDLDLSPPYQPAIFVNRRAITEPMRVVDGKQRLEAILDFVPATFASRPSGSTTSCPRAGAILRPATRRPRAASSGSSASRPPCRCAPPRSPASTPSAKRYDILNFAGSLHAPATDRALPLPTEEP